MKILGVDPGYDRTGYALLEVSEERSPELLISGTITTSRALSFQKRLTALFENLQELISQWHPDGLAVEKLYWGKNVKTATGVAHARGVVMLAADMAGLIATEYTPTTVKLSLTGNGKAQKHQIRYMVEQIIDIPPGKSMHDDEFDAIALALVDAAKRGFLIKG